MMFALCLLAAFACGVVFGIAGFSRWLDNIWNT